MSALSKTKLRTLREAVRVYRRAVWSRARERETETVRRLDILDAACDLFPTVGRKPRARKMR